MTSANVLQCGSAKQSQTLNANAAKGKTKDENLEAASIFSSMMNSGYSAAPLAADSGNDNTPHNVKNVDNAAGDSYERYQFRDREIDPADTYSVADKISDSSEELEGFEDELIQTVAEDLGVEVEKLMAVLEELGLTAFDLLDSQNLVQVALQLTPENVSATPADLLMDSQFVDLMQDVSNIGTQLAEELELAPEQMDEFVAQMHIFEQPEEILEMETPENEMQNPENVSVMTEAASTEAQKLQETGEQEMDEQIPVEKGMSSIEAPEEQKTAKDASMSNASEEQQKEQDGFTRNENNTVKSTNTTREPGQPVETVFTVNEMAEPELVQPIPVADNSYLSIDTMDLIQQIAEQVKVSISEGTSSMEMQLNPENLGRIYLQISAKEGSVNATIAAQNEAVKAALEMQVADLKQSLNQAGVKVDAIEVTVAAHEFEKNLEQGQNREKEQGERQQELSQRRNINLSSEDELLSDMTEEETLVAQMMRDNGNSVDLTA